MTKSLIKNTFREIKNTKARFISIMAIIALGVGFFAGIKATVPSMYNLARTYTDEQELMDYRLVSTVGFDEDDIKAVKNTDGVTCYAVIFLRCSDRCRQRRQDYESHCASRKIR